LIGVVGEVYCRLNTFSNEELVRCFEAAGAEVWLNDLGEWFWYTNSVEARAFARCGRSKSLASIKAKLRNRIQASDEHKLLAPFRKDFLGREEPGMEEVLRNAEPYLPAEGADGEMVVNIGKAIHFAKKGLAGVIDISPFTCMNGIVGEAIYPRVSRDHGGIPIRNFYFDGTQSEFERDVGIFLELAHNYRQKARYG
jgi:predicted nucleotide-binding protein (sugar kinase/HSP70/actin superfamily)